MMAGGETTSEWMEWTVSLRLRKVDYVMLEPTGYVSQIVKGLKFYPSCKVSS